MKENKEKHCGKCDDKGEPGYIVCPDCPCHEKDSSECKCWTTKDETGSPHTVPRDCPTHESHMHLCTAAACQPIFKENMKKKFRVTRKEFEAAVIAINNNRMNLPDTIILNGEEVEQDPVKDEVCREEICRKNHTAVCNNPECNYVEKQPHLHHEPVELPELMSETGEGELTEFMAMNNRKAINSIIRFLKNHNCNK